MKFSYPVTCGCGETFSVNVAGTQFPRSTECPKCHLTIWLIPPLGNVVGMAILGRALTEIKNGDSTIAIVLSAMAVESELVYLFMKWNRIDLMFVRTPNEADEERWEEQWRNEVRTIAARLDKVSVVLTGQYLDSFVSENSNILHSVHARYPASKSARSAKEFFVRELFHRRNKIVHSGEIDFPQQDAEMCLVLATALFQILGAMDAQRRVALEASSRAKQ